MKGAIYARSAIVNHDSISAQVEECRCKAAGIEAEIPDDLVFVDNGTHVEVLEPPISTFSDKEGE